MQLRYLLTILAIVTVLFAGGCAKKESTPPGDAAGDTYSSNESTAESSTTQSTIPPFAPPTAGNTPADAQAPRSITILSSLPDLVAYEKVEIKGKTRPGYRVFIDGQEVTLNPKGEFNLPYSLQVGGNSIRVATLGKEKIEETRTLNIERKPTPPMLTVVPPDRSEGEYLTISGQTEKGCIVYVNSTPAAPDRLGNFSSAVLLKEGVNTVKITSTNRDGGTAAFEKKVTFTPPNPTLEVIIPDTSNTKQVTISGITDTNTVLVVYVNEIRSGISQQNGIFSGTVTLEDGINKITVTAINKWGKKATVSGDISLSAQP
ncbi:MAG: hypothetical protein ACYDEQ_11080 [Desulfocucumaceae bacterium]